MRLISNFILFFAFFTASHFSIQAQKLATNSNQILGEWHFVHEPNVMQFNANGTYFFRIPLDKAGLYTKNRKLWDLYEQGKWTFSPEKGLLLTPNKAGADDEKPKYQPVYLYENYLFLGDFETEFASNGEVQELNREEYIKEWGYKKNGLSKKK